MSIRTTSQAKMLFPHHLLVGPDEPLHPVGMGPHPSRELLPIATMRCTCLGDIRLIESMSPHASSTESGFATRRCDTPERLASVLVPVAHGLGTAGAGSRGMNGMASEGAARPAGKEAFLPLGQVATIRQTAGPMVVRTEGALPTAWVYVDVVGRDIGSYVAEARRVVLPILWSAGTGASTMKRIAAPMVGGMGAAPC